MLQMPAIARHILDNTFVPIHDKELKLKIHFIFFQFSKMQFYWREIIKMERNVL